LLKKLSTNNFRTTYWTAFLLQNVIVIFLGKCVKRLNAQFPIFVSRTAVVSHNFQQKKNIFAMCQSTECPIYLETRML